MAPVTVLTVPSTTSPAFVPVSVTVVTSGSGKLPLVDVDDDGSSAGSDGVLVPPLVGREPVPPVPGRLGVLVGATEVDGAAGVEPPLAVALVDVPETGLTLVVVFERPLVERCAPRRVLAVFSAAVARLCGRRPLGGSACRGAVTQRVDPPQRVRRASGIRVVDRGARAGARDRDRRGRGGRLDPARGGRVRNGRGPLRDGRGVAGADATDAVASAAETALEEGRERQEGGDLRLDRRVDEDARVEAGEPRLAPAGLAVGDVARHAALVARAEGARGRAWR